MSDSLDFRVIFIASNMSFGRRREAVTAVEFGIERLDFQAVGNWLKDCVDSYFCFNERV